ncbi:MAG: LytTR family DNA-binding domain-containing protein [Atopobiaceae bacterium]|jgi:DNA-binding LytR/AlgR family response regulator|nr:LytTR family DNA-binding domain-containing protein [Atopobiaceae bacterium]MCH4181118.1 LytTR family DNA-binding domain-containing protein [Atopobiaceae bacterium]MCH4214083.1 LytTR family DNA-binding domain-containing protein [Atopobiaceae bacterium]MCH4229546.1 LytTR family DNA-binding domain-containing protein [Atopobiaceae bacterium]MCH4276435.1 LytTR family DNA-binding domain-containing protein [Atopobiaceae bacterium]
MLHAMIVDDEAPARSELRYLLEETGRVDGAITEASSAREAVEKLMDARPDVLFLDVSMPKTSGMQLAEALHKLKNPPAVVFVTAYSEYALEAFNVDAVDYLMKPVETDRLNTCLDKVQARTAPTSQPSSSVERIPVEKSGRKVLVPIDQIRYIEAKDDYSCIYTDTDRYLSTISLAQLESKLSPHGFFRVHRGYIVNLQYVEEAEVISSGILQLGLNGIEGKKISVSRRRVVQLKRALGL